MLNCGTTNSKVLYGENEGGTKELSSKVSSGSWEAGIPASISTRLSLLVLLRLRRLLVPALSAEVVRLPLRKAGFYRFFHLTRVVGNSLIED